VIVLSSHRSIDLLILKVIVSKELSHASELVGWKATILLICTPVAFYPGSFHSVTIMHKFGTREKWTEPSVITIGYSCMYAVNAHSGKCYNAAERRVGARPCIVHI